MKRLVDGHWWHQSLAPLVALVVVCIVAGGVTGAYFVTRNVNQARTNHDLICRLDLLFGLDQPLPRNELEKLRPSQRAALHQIIQACPELGRKGTP